MKRDELLVRFEQHRDNADELLAEADSVPNMVSTAVRANAHATMALLYLTDLLSSSQYE